MPRCTWLLSNGEQCRASAVKGATVCLFHSQVPEVKQNPKQYEKKSTFIPGAKEPLSNLDDLCGFIAKIMNDVRSGDLDEERGKVLTIAAKELRLTIAARDSHKQIEGIETMDDADIIKELKNYAGSK